MDDKSSLLLNKKEKVKGAIAAIPALLICAVTVVMLLLDIMIPSMSDAQYMIYPLLMRIASAFSIICAAVIAAPVIKGESARLGLSRILLLLFLLCILISTVLNGFDRDALMGVQFRYIGVFDMVTMIIAYMMCTGSVYNRKLKGAVLVSYMIAADLIAAAFLIDMRTGIIKAFSNKNEPSAIFFHGNHYAYFLAVAVAISAGLCFIISGFRAAIPALSLGINLFALFMNRSLGGILAVFAVFFASFILIMIKGGTSRKRILIPFSVTIVTLVLSLLCNADLRWDLWLFLGDILRITSGTEKHYSDHGRIDMWVYTIGLIKERPLTGYGCEGISAVLGERFDVDNPHNEVITYAAYYGIPAALIYVSAVISAIVQAVGSSDSVRVVAAAATTVYFVSSLFGVAMFYTLPFFFVLLGLTAEGPADKMRNTHN